MSDIRTAMVSRQLGPDYYEGRCPVCAGCFVAGAPIRVCPDCLWRAAAGERETAALRAARRHDREWQRVLAAEAIAKGLRRIGKAHRQRAQRPPSLCPDCRHLWRRCTCEVPVTAIDWFGECA